MSGIMNHSMNCCLLLLYALVLQLIFGPLPLEGHNRLHLLRGIRPPLLLRASRALISTGCHELNSVLNGPEIITAAKAQYVHQHQK